MGADHKLLVCGSRDWTDADMIAFVLSQYRDGITRVITGGARGADQMAEAAAARLGYDTLVMRADWKLYGKHAGFIRNSRMLDENPDEVLAFTLGSPGTQHTINEARRRGIPVRVFGVERTAALTAREGSGPEPPEASDG